MTQQTQKGTSLEEIERLWSEDSMIDQDRLAGEAAKIPNLHAKYYRIYIRENVILRQIEDEAKTLARDLYLYYTGAMTHTELKDRGWQDFDLTILKTEVPRFIDSDEHMQKIRLRQMIQSEKCAFVKSILDNISNRAWVIRHIIDWKKFEAGM